MTIKAALANLNNAILDLQGSDYNTYERPLKRLGKALEDDSLKDINAKLKDGLDLDRFLAEADQGGGMAGSASLNWPEDPEKELGLGLMLIERGAADPNWFMNFAHHYFYSGSKLIAGIQKLTGAVIIPFGRDYKTYVEGQAPVRAARREPTDLNRIFIVHGHDDGARETVARFIGDVGLEPIILHEQASRGMTIPEKLVFYSNVGFAVVLLTPDDVGRSNNEVDLKSRARQNVLLELGYFVGSLGRDRVCALRKGDVDIPSDYLGVVYTSLDDAGAWKQSLAQELHAAGYEIDWNKVMAKRSRSTS